MDRKRHVNRLLSIFDLGDYRGSGLPADLSARVMFLYDEKENVSEFRMLDRDLPIETNLKIASWLRDNLNVADLIHKLSYRADDAETIDPS